MAEQLNFRSAFHGFNREDVVNYLQYLNNKHASEISQLNSELDYLRSRQDATPTEPETVPAADRQNEQIQELLDSCREKDALLETMTAEADAMKAEIEALKAALAAKSEPVQAIPVSRPDDELEIYRRAERVERRARERAELIYYRVNGTLGEATAKVEETASVIGEMSDRVLSQLQELQNAVTGSKAALHDAVETMTALRPEAEE